jgi:signal transduction histidine kinase
LPDITNELLEPGVLLPLQTRGKILGVLGIINPAGSLFTADQISLFKSIADQLGGAIANAYLFQRAEDTAVIAERNRLARDLHDAVTQTLFSASMIADVIPKIWEKRPEEGRKRLEELRQLTRGALSEMRTLLVELRPTALEDTDLTDLIRHQINAFIARARVEVNYICHSTHNPLPEIKEMTYRIAQEALNNIAKHAEASSVMVELNSQIDQLELIIQDNGRGFDLESGQLEGLGLGIMAERANALGAQFQINSQIGEGSQIRLLWIRSE